MPRKDKSYRWENDIFAGPMSSASEKMVKTQMYETFKRQGVKPESIRDKATSEAYAAWLAEQEKK